MTKKKYGDWTLLPMWGVVPDAAEVAMSVAGQVIAYREQLKPKSQRRYFWVNHQTGLVNLSDVDYGMGYVELEVLDNCVVSAGVSAKEK